MAKPTLPTKRYRETRTRSLYVIGAPSSPLVKIGVSDCPRLRLRDLRQATDTTLAPSALNRGALILLHQEPGGRAQELALHRYFAHRRVIGEWFDLGPVAVPLIKSVLRELNGRDCA